MSFRLCQVLLLLFECLCSFRVVIQFCMTRQVATFLRPPSGHSPEATCNDSMPYPLYKTPSEHPPNNRTCVDKRGLGKHPNHEKGVPLLNKRIWKDDICSVAELQCPYSIHPDPFTSCTANCKKMRAWHPERKPDIDHRTKNNVPNGFCTYATN